MHKHTEEVLQAIRAANPKLIELSFGCEIRHNGVEQTILHVSQRHPFWFEAKSDSTDGKYLDYETKAVEIIGHEPHLEHLLAAIYQKGSRYKTLWKLECDGQFMEYVSESNQTFGREYYNFTHPLAQNLEENEPLRTMLHELLVMGSHASSV